MSRRTRSLLRALAVIVVLIAVLMELGLVVIPVLVKFKFWAVVIAFGLMLVTTK